ncbi:reverse transcriptase domain-containing protein [Bradyrhizobium sp. USDA 4474]
MRYADDIVVGFEHEAGARRFWDDMRKRFEEFSLSLNPDKTRLIEFGRFAAERRAHRGLGKPETFNFLGFTFICERNRRGQFLVKRTTRRDRMRATLKRVKEELFDGACTTLSRARGLAQASGQRLLRLSCGADQRSCTESILLLCDTHLAAHAAAARPEGPLLMAANAKASRRLAPSTAYPSPVSGQALRRHAPKAGAVCGNSACTDLGGGRSANDRPYRASI